MREDMEYWRWLQQGRETKLGTEPYEEDVRAVTPPNRKKPKEEKDSAIKFSFSSYYNSDSMRAMSLFCSNQTLPSWNDGNQRYP